VWGLLYAGEVRTGPPHCVYVVYCERPWRDGLECMRRQTLARRLFSLLWDVRACIRCAMAHIGTATTHVRLAITAPGASQGTPQLRKRAQTPPCPRPRPASNKRCAVRPESEGGRGPQANNKVRAPHASQRFQHKGTRAHQGVHAKARASVASHPRFSDRHESCRGSHERLLVQCGGAGGSR
jgi:hypothetical protein